MSQSNQNNREDIKSVPRSSRGWYRLIKDEIDIEPEDASREDCRELAQKHAEQVVERTEMDVDLTDIDWQIVESASFNGEASSSGKIQLSFQSLIDRGWARFMETVRHEVVHIWQFQTMDQRGHGPTFEDWMKKLNIAKTSRASEPEYVPSEQEEYVFLYNQVDEDSSIEWFPKTIKLTTLPGIGGWTTEQIGSDILRIDDLMDGTDPDPEIFAWVPSHHNELREKLIDLYETVPEKRTDSDLELLQRAQQEDGRDWWKPMYRIGGEPVRLSLRHNIQRGAEEGRRFKLRFADSDNFHYGNITHSGLTINIHFDEIVDGCGADGQICAQENWPEVSFSGGTGKYIVEFEYLE